MEKTILDLSHILFILSKNIPLHSVILISTLFLEVIAMSLTVGTDTYIDGPGALAYCVLRYPQVAAIQAITDGTIAPWEGALLRAVDAIETLEPAMWQGWKTNVSSPLQWPRVAVTDRRRNAWGYSPVYGFGFFFDPNAMPDVLQYAQAEEALLLFLLDSDPGYLPSLLDEQKGVAEVRIQQSRVQYQPHPRYGGLIHSARAWQLLLQLRRDCPARVVMC